MPPRVARSSVQGSRPSKPRSGGRNPKKAQKRALNAFSIASHEHPDRVKIRKNRLGELDPSFHRKRARYESGDEDDDDEDEESNEPKRRKQLGDNVEEGSDSDGNTWTMGHVDDDDDEEIDSDEAFGESDEERFADFTFRGSAQNQKGKKSVKSKKREAPTDDSEGDIDLDEGESADGEEEDEDDLGEDAIDLATALDQWEEDEEDDRKKKNKKKNKTSAFESSDESSGSDEHSDSSSEDEDEEDRRAQLQDLISSLPNRDPGRSRNKGVEVHESSAPDEFGVSRKVDLTSFKPKGVDDERKKALKLLQDDKSSKRNDIARKLDAPLPKRQQDKLDRAAANTKTNETLDRWTDTIKQNRRAEHLSFPLQHKNSGKSMGQDRLLPTTASAPTNDLENAIQSILQQSGLSNGKDDEEQIQKWEELQTNKLPLEEVLRRRAELRRERELLFREEVRAKRIKKIKSKAYRRVHRKERERLLERERDALKADGVDVSEDEREYNDRRRAEERMGAKHRESKWAKGVKATGRAAWDADALAGVTEMAKRNEELRRRIEGKAIRDSDDEGSDIPSSDESSEEDEDGGDEVLQRQLSKLRHNPFSTDNSKLGQMAFMQKAEAARRAQNDEAIESMRRELAGEDSISEDEVENSTKVGRRKFGPGGNDAAPAIQLNRSEFEERAGSDEEQETSTNPATDGPSNGSRKDKDTKKNAINGMANAARKPVRTDDNGEADVGSQNPYLVKAKKDRKTESKPVDGTFLDDMVSKTQKKSQSMSKPASKVLESSVDEFLQQRVTVPDDEGWTTVLGDDQEEDDDQYDDLENEGVDLDVVLRNQQLTAKGFAGDDVLAEFESEKKATIQEEDSQEITNVLPGWGAWTGENLTAAEKKRKGFKTVTKREGIDPTLRKDAKLDRVIINEKRMKPNVKYMASQLPFPFETREQYERSLRVPKGKEWTTKKTFQDATKPRVIVKQGIIKPMRKPMV